MRTKDPIRLAMASAEERDEWDETRAEAAKNRKRSEAARFRSRDKQKAADLKAFKLRGYRGKNVPEDANREEFKVRKAHRTRLATGTQVDGGPLRNIPSLKAKRSTLAAEPWERVKPPRVKEGPPVKKETRKGSIRHMLRQFRSEGKLPHLTLLTAEALPKTELTNTEKKHLKLLGEAMMRNGVSRQIVETLLQRGGVEMNPGPCSLTGQTVTTKVEKYGRKFLHTCPECGVPLMLPTKTSEPMQFFHEDMEAEPYWETQGKEPDDLEFMDALDTFYDETEPGKESCTSPALEPVTVAPAPAARVASTSKGKEEPHADPVAVNRERKREIKQQIAAKNKTINVCRTINTILPDPPPNVRERAAPPPPPVAPAAPPAPPAPPAVLKGFVMDHDAEVEFMVTTQYCAPGTVVSEKKVIHYDQERRLVCDRNVKATAQDMEVVQLSGMGVNTKIPYLGPLLNSILWLLTTPLSLHWVAWVPTMVAFVGFTLNVFLSFSFIVSWLYFVFLFPWILLLTLLSVWASYYYMKALEPKVQAFREWVLKVTKPFWVPRHIYYVPHALSNVVTSYRAGTDLHTLNSTVGQRLGRLSTLPIPDEVHTQLMAGTERVAVFCVMRQPFFDTPLVL